MGYSLTLISKAGTIDYQKGNTNLMRIFVSNLPNDTSEHELRKLFSRHGRVVKSWVVEDHDSGEGRRHGFVEMTMAEAKNAIRIMDRSWFKSRRINVQKSRFVPGRGRRERRDTTSERPVRINHEQAI